MILKDECKKVGLSVGDFSQLVDVPTQTLRDWCVSRPILLEILFSGVAANNVLDRIEEMRHEYNTELAHGESPSCFD